MGKLIMDNLILDCTLRDGGYVNNWEFDIPTAVSIMDGLYSAGVRWIEIGIMGLNPVAGKQTKFSDFDQMKPFLENRKADCHYAVMVTTALSDRFEYPRCSGETPDVIRIAYFKSELEKTLNLAERLKEHGYRVFLQAMATFMYSDEELRATTGRINRLNPAAFYMVDSFSTMYPDDVVRMRDLVLSEMRDDVLFGFHAHNNIQLAFANVREFMDIQADRGLMADASIYGMGRGAGNVPLELLMAYMNRKCGASFNTAQILSLYQEYLEPIYQECGWGYSASYYLTAVNSLNSAWGWFFMNKGITDLGELECAFKMIPSETAHKLDRKIADGIVEKIRKMS